MLELLMLDVRTLAFTSCVSGFLMAATMAGIYMAGMRSRALIDWSLAGLSSGLGYLTGHILQTVEVPVPAWMAGALANSLITLGLGLVLVGVQRYLGLRTWLLAVVLASVATLASMFVFPELRESLRLRIIFLSGLYVVFCAVAGGLLWGARRPGMRRFHRAVAAVLLVYALFLFARLLHALATPVLTTSFVQNPMQMSTFLVAMIFGFCLTMALAVMMFREKQVELADLAEKDPLTGLNNRHSLDQIAERLLRRAAEQQGELSLILLDVDHFKRINDDHGHQVGDQVLAEIGRRIRNMLRDSDVAFRVGGEEFLVLLPGASGYQAEQVAERLRSAIEDQLVTDEGRSLSITASLGVAACKNEEAAWEEGYRRADKALYQAKKAGRNQVATLA